MTEFKQKTEGTKRFISISGPIDEQTRFPAPDVHGLDLLEVNCERVGWINSIGVSKWIRWMDSVMEANASLSIVFERVPSLMVKMAAVVDEFFASRSAVRSFYITYSCTVCDSQTSILFENTADLDSEEFSDLGRVASSNACVKCGFPMELESNVLACEQMKRFIP